MDFTSLVVLVVILTIIRMVLRRLLVPYLRQGSKLRYLILIPVLFMMFIIVFTLIAVLRH